MLGLVLTSCEIEPTIPTAAATVDGSSILTEIALVQYETCLKENEQDPKVCDSLKTELDEKTATSEALAEAFRGVDPKPIPVPVPPQPCPQGQCLDLFEDIVALIFPIKEDIQEVRLVADQEVLASASGFSVYRSSTIDFSAELIHVFAESMAAVTTAKSMEPIDASWG